MQVVQTVVQQKTARLVSTAQKRKSHRVPNATVTRAPPRSPAVLSIRKPRGSSETALKEPRKATMAPVDQTPWVDRAVQELPNVVEKRETGRGSRDDRGPRTELVSLSQSQQRVSLSFAVGGRPLELGQR